MCLDITSLAFSCCQFFACLKCSAARRQRLSTGVKGANSSSGFAKLNAHSVELVPMRTNAQRLIQHIQYKINLIDLDRVVTCCNIFSSGKTNTCSYAGLMRFRSICAMFQAGCYVGCDTLRRHLNVRVCGSFSAESPSSVTRKSSSSVTRTCFLNCDAVPLL